MADSHGGHGQSGAPNDRDSQEYDENRTLIQNPQSMPGANTRRGRHRILQEESDDDEVVRPNVVVTGSVRAVLLR